ncbi:ankyrin-2-like isoform X1 [Lates japonicus]|uniref:Ankyrin-2-like isoform X1 n=1 Tax=Lates japonicus TaxID=270547 RepID=A0AAD3RGT7_LATJO|nr:ankyrin-2-like isoform X1 [Lates japonicus]
MFKPEVCIYDDTEEDDSIEPPRTDCKVSLRLSAFMKTLTAPARQAHRPHLGSPGSDKRYPWCQQSDLSSSLVITARRQDHQSQTPMGNRP